MPDEDMALAQAYRASQVRIGLALTKDILTIWRYFDPEHIDQSWGQVLRAVLVMTSESRVKSAAQSEAYFRALSPYPEVRAALAARRVPSHIQTAAEKADWEARAATSLEITGNYMTKSAIERGLTAREAVDEAFVRVSGVSQRHALDGGRAKMFELGDAAGVMKWRRIGGANPCSFCRMLINRGAVYRRATSTFRTHDHCQCMATPDTTGAFAPKRYGFTRQPGESEREFYKRYATVTDPSAYLGGRAPASFLAPSAVEPPWDEINRIRAKWHNLAPITFDDVTRARMMDTLAKAEGAIANQQAFESLVVIGPDGTLLGKIDGGATSVGGYEADKLIQSAPVGSILTHNHPLITQQGQRVANFFSTTDLRTSLRYGFIPRMIRVGDGITQAELTDYARSLSNMEWVEATEAVIREQMIRLDRLYPGPGGWQKYRLVSDWVGQGLVDAGLITTNSILPDAVLLANPPSADELQKIVNYMSGYGN